MDHRYHAEPLPISHRSASIPDHASANGVARSGGWRFDGFEFDLLRAELRGRDGARIALRPKADALLRVFLAHPGRLLGRDELIAAVWPAAVVTDDSLVQCVGELRTAFGDDGPRFIQTIPRRGYRFEPAVTPVGEIAAEGTAKPAGPAPSIRRPTSAPDPAGGMRAPRPVKWLAVGLVAGAAILGVGAALDLRPASAPIGIDETIASRVTVAIMPLVAASGEPRLRGLADAVADGIAAELASRIGMRGIGRAATAPFDSASAPLDRIGSALKATHVLTGRVASVGTGERLSIDVQITAVASGEVIWSKRFEASGPSDAVVVSDVGQRVAVAMRRAGPSAGSSRGRTPESADVPDAADLTLIGWGDLDRRKSLADVRRARERFEAALRQDPRLVIALNGLSATYLIERNDPLSELTPAQVTEHERLVNLSSSLAPDNDTTLTMWGHTQLLRGRPDLALPAFEKANRRVPSQPSAYVDVATARLLLGRAGEVQALADRAVELGAGDARRVSPAYLIAAEAALFLGEDERAHELARLAVAELPSNARAHATLAAIEALADRNELARSEMAAFLALWPTATLERFDAQRPSNHPVYLAQRVRLYEGLRKAGLPER